MIIIRVVDLETSDMPPEGGIIQIGKCDVTFVDGQASVGEPQSMFVNCGKPISATARAVHHIRDKDIEGAPSVDSGLIWLNTDEPQFWCAHNAAFERQLFSGGHHPWICTLKVGRRIWPDAPAHGNQVLRYHLHLDDLEGFDGWNALPSHRAGPDAFVTAHLLAQALRLASIDDMLKWTNEPSLLPGNINFGKHRGTPWAQLPPDYLEWMCRAQDMNEDAKFTARHHLTRRMADAR